MSLAERRGQASASIEPALEGLSLDNGKGKGAPRPSKKSKDDDVADSWEDDAESGSGGSDTETEGPSIKPTMPGPPPPTPVTPGYKAPPDRQQAEFEDPYAFGSTGGAPLSDGRRPEKQNATASRMIAGALGLKAPKRTEEQRAYDRATREREQRRRDKEKEDKKKAEQESEKAKASIWDD